MDIKELRFRLTGKERTISLFRQYENEKLLISPYITNRNLAHSVEVIEDDIGLKLEIPTTADKKTLAFLKYDYNEDLFKKSEVLAFLYAGINKEWDVVKGYSKTTRKPHFYLKHENYIYDPSLAIITSDELYGQEYDEEEVIKNADVDEYLEKNNNLYPYYRKFLSIPLFKKKSMFSSNLLNNFRKAFQKSVEAQYEFPKDIQEVREYYGVENFRQIRQLLTRKRNWELESDEILLHPDVNPEILEQIEEDTSEITKRMEPKFPGRASYHNGTMRNCYALSIMYNIYNGDFKLVQGGFNYTKRSEFFPKHGEPAFFQHSWLEKDDIVYDPALMMVVPKDLYYRIFEKKDVYTKDETKDMLKRVGLNLTYFSDFLNGKRIGNDQTLLYRMRSTDTPERKAEGEEFISCLE